MAINKVIYGGNVLIDLTGDTITPDKLAEGVKAHDASGAQITGTNTYDSDTQDATATADEILTGKTAYVRGSKIIGSMKNNGGTNGTITTKAEHYIIPQGFHDGSGKVGIDETEQAKLIPGNIRQGVTVLGVQGTMSGTEGANPQVKTVTPTTTEQTILPDDGFNYLSQVTVAAIPYTENDNSAGGKTVTIA